MKGISGKCYLGSDPEFFFVNKGQVVPSEKFLPWKEQPMVVSDNTLGAAKGSKSNGVALHADGVQGEITLAESNKRVYLLARLREALRNLYKLAPSGTEISLSASCKTPPEFLAAEVSERGKEFGCDPDYVSWLDGAPNISFPDPHTHPFRYAGAHVHIGYMPGNSAFAKEVQKILMSPLGKIRVVNMMDMILGNTMVLLDQSPESTTRRELYGKAGTFRYTSYGLEYRVLSNFWLKHPALANIVFALSREALNIVISGFDKKFINLFENSDPIIEAINENNKKLAFMNWMKIRPLLTMLSTEGINYQALEFLGTLGIDQVVPNIKDSWKITGNDYEDKEGTLLEGQDIVNLLPKKDFKTFLKGYSVKEIYV
jgi:hypothetical protein